jgi:GrpB protein
VGSEREWLLLGGQGRVSVGDRPRLSYERAGSCRLRNTWVGRTSVVQVADMAVEIADYDQKWQTNFAEQRDLLTPVLQSWLSGPIEHIGSTAVLGLASNRSSTCSPRSHRSRRHTVARYRSLKTPAGCFGRQTRIVPGASGSCVRGWTLEHTTSTSSSTTTRMCASCLCFAICCARKPTCVTGTDC